MPKLAYMPVKQIIMSTMASADVAILCGLKARVGCQDRLRVNSDADKTLA